MGLSSHRQRIVWFAVLVALTVIFAVGGVELSQSSSVSGVGYLMLIFGLPLAIIGLGLVGVSLSKQER
ncbi:MAG TPA: hypothetical protein VJQ45_13890 [Ktedonobacterales bacterium]|nr:hypothetical protein [Ktedonobacterales bacterium]